MVSRLVGLWVASPGPGIAEIGLSFTTMLPILTGNTPELQKILYTPCAYTFRDTLYALRRQKNVKLHGKKRLGMGRNV
jgi:hypothetical protein